MTTATIERELHKVVETQKKFEAELDFIKNLVANAIVSDGNEEVRPEYLKKLARIEASMNRGEGIAFRTDKELRNYFDKLRK